MAETQSNAQDTEDGTLAHVQKPKEPQRIHPDGAATPVADENDTDTKSKSRPKTDGGSKKQKDEDDEDDSDDDGDDAEAKPESKKDKKQQDKNGKGKDKADDEASKRPVYKKPAFWIFVVVLVIGAIVGFFYWLHARDYESTDDAFIEGHAIQISPQVAARVLKVYIDDNTRVKQGDPLLDLDPTDYQVALTRAKGNEDASQGKLEQAKAMVNNAKGSRDEANANLDAANVAFENADRDLKRYEALDDRARSKQQYDNAITAQKNAAAQVAQSKARLATAESQIAVNIASVTAAQGEYETAVANRKQAEVNLGYCHITAPETGRVTTKNVEPGMYASTGTPLFALVQENVWVVANYKETQLTDMKIGQPVTIEVDAYPDQKYDGHIDSIQAGSGSRFSVLPAENATGNYVKVVQRIPVKIVFEEGQTKDPNHLLAPGMSVTPYVKIR